MTRKAYWEFALDGIKVGGSALGGSTASAIADTGTSLLIGPKAEVTKLIAGLNLPPDTSSGGGQGKDGGAGAADSDAGSMAAGDASQITVPCEKRDELPTLTFVIGGRRTSWPVRLRARGGRVGKEQCLLGITGTRD